MSRSRTIVGSACFAWLAVVGAGMASLAYYDQQAGETLAAPARIAPLAAEAPKKQRLLVFIHPRCPCSTASLRELERLMSRCRNEVEAKVYFIRPENEPDSWARGSLWTLAQQIPGTTTSIDAGGKVSRQYAATTSGAIVVYSADGKLQYQGGITAARGHEGDSRGKEAIFAIARGETQEVSQCPVYGCPLWDKASQQE